MAALLHIHIRSELESDVYIDIDVFPNGLQINTIGLEDSNKFYPMELSEAKLLEIIYHYAGILDKEGHLTGFDVEISRPGSKFLLRKAQMNASEVIFRTMKDAFATAIRGCLPIYAPRGSYLKVNTEAQYNNIRSSSVKVSVDGDDNFGIISYELSQSEEFFMVKVGDETLKVNYEGLQMILFNVINKTDYQDDQGGVLHISLNLKYNNIGENLILHFSATDDINDLRRLSDGINPDTAAQAIVNFYDSVMKL